MPSRSGSAAASLSTTGDFHRPEHLHGWKTLLPCPKDAAGVVEYLRSPRPAFLTLIDPRVQLRIAA